jgi:Holliday junction DNA helicase RuvA
LGVEEVRNAIVNEEVGTIQKVKGIGSKTAQRIILELKDKLKKEGFEASTSHSPAASIKSEALAALTTLGIGKAVAEKNIDRILRIQGNEISLEELIKLVLKQS